VAGRVLHAGIAGRVLRRHRRPGAAPASPAGLAARRRLTGQAVGAAACCQLPAAYSRRFGGRFIQAPM
jgi:hypothetical protein